MDRHIACACGHAGPVGGPEDGPIVCPACGSTLADSADVPPGSGRPPATMGPATSAEPFVPAPVRVTREGAGWFGRDRPCMAALGDDAVWIQALWDPAAVVRIPLAGTAVTHSPSLRRMTLVPGDAAGAGSTTVVFETAPDEARFRSALSARAEGPAGEPGRVPVAVAPAVCVRGRVADIPCEILGPLEARGPSDAAADGALALCAVMLGADAVVGVSRDKVLERSRTLRKASGTAVRARDAGARQRLREAWYAEEVGSLVRRCLLIVSIVVVVGGFADAWLTSPPAARVGSVTVPAPVVSIGWTLPWFAWPLLLALFLGWSRWPGFLRPLAIAILAATTLRGLGCMIAHLVAHVAAQRGTILLGVFVDPVEWGLVLWGAVLAATAWRLAQARGRLDGDDTPSTGWAGVWMPWAASLLYACVITGVAVTARYTVSRYLLQPGVQLRAESIAGGVLDEGIAALERNDTEAAERLLQQARLQWERLTDAPSVPLHYHTNLGYALNNLSWLREAQGRLDEAERYASRCAGMERTVSGGGPDDAEFREVIGHAKQALARLEGNAAAGAVVASDDAARLKYEEAIVASDRDPAAACRLMNEAIAAWETVLGGAVEEGARSYVVQRLAYAHLRLAGFEDAAGHRDAAKTALQKGIESLERLKDADPDGVLLARNLGAARDHLDELHEQEFEEGIERLTSAQRFGDVIEAYRRGIAELEGRTGESAKQRLARRLDGFAWLLTHCPVERLRDLPTALGHARRATELVPGSAAHWYTLAIVAYRNAAWQDSLAALEREEAIVGSSDPGDCFLRAMILFRLGQRDAAAAALRRGKEMVDELERRAGQNPVLRLQHDLIRPAMEALRQEAEALLEGRDVARASWRGSARHRT